MGKEGVFLTGGWCPRVKGLVLYKTTVTLPLGHRAMMPFESVREERKMVNITYSFHFSHPIRTMPLVATPYKVFRARAQGVNLGVYLLEKDDNLAQKYLVARVLGKRGYMMGGDSQIYTPLKVFLRHVAYGYGIPSRVEKRGVSPCSIVIMGNDQKLDPHIGDYLVVPPPAKPPFSAKLGVIIKEGKEGLLIKMVAPHTPAQRSGLRKGDLIVEADGHPIEKIEDLRTILYQKKPKDTIQVTVLRSKKRLVLTIGPFFGQRPVAF
jgi:membrane-associated protease RseP (regulator of RpoE activity)